MGTTFRNLQVEGFVDEQEFAAISHVSESNWKKGIKIESIEREPTSVLDHSCSLRSPNSVSTKSSSINGGRGYSGGLAMQDLEGLSFGGEGSLLPLLMGEVVDPNLYLKNLIQSGTSLGFDGYGGLGTTVNSSGVENLGNFCASIGGGFGFPGSGFNCNGKVEEQFRISDEKPQVVDPRFGFGEQEVQNPNHCFASLGYSQEDAEHPYLPPAKRHNYDAFGPDPGAVPVSRGESLSDGHDDFLRKQEQQFQMHQQQLIMSMGPQHLQKSTDHYKNSRISVLRDLLIKVVEMFQTGNFALAQVILARLNHEASLPGKPLIATAALCVKEELEKLLSMNNMPAAPPPPRSLSLDDVIHKISAYKLFSEVSPFMQFVDFTCTQALLEALEDADTIHILDFDIGCGSMWASFIRELPLRKKGALFLKITVLASTSSHHPFELALICDNILEFATESGVSVDIKVLNLDLFDSGSCTFPDFHLLENEIVAIKFPVWACSHCPFLLPPLLSFMKQCSPKIVISFDRGGDCSDLAFPSHILHGLSSCSSILESLNCSSVPAEIIRKVENFLIKPSIERTIQGRIYAPDKMQGNKMRNWMSLFPSSGFVPATLSNFTEYQAHELVTKFPVRGFNVEKSQASIKLRWMSHDLVTGLAWRC